ncbi:MAG: diguanylate cyclase [Nitrospirota bacterium]
MRDRNLIKYFFILSFLTAISFPILNIYYIFPSFSQLLAQNTEDEAVRVARRLSELVVDESNNLKTPESFYESLNKAKEHYNLDKIKLFSRHGEIIYSTDPKDIGERNRHGYFNEIVSKGNSYSVIVQKESESLEGQLMHADVVETYVPIMDRDRFVGAFEIYYDITNRNEMMGKTVSSSSVISFALMFVFFLGMLILILRTDKKEIHAQTTDKHNSPFYLLITIIVSIFTAEAVTMFFISYFPSHSRINQALLDGALLTMTVSPALFFFLFRPMQIHIDKHKQNEKELMDAQNELVVFNTDLHKQIEERKKAETLILKSQQEWEDTFNVITDMITIHDKDFNIIKANKAAGRILDMPFLNDKKLKCYKYYHGTDAPPEGCPSCGCLHTGKPSVFELFEPHLNRHIEIRAIPRFDENNRINGLIHVVRDITDRHNLEESLRSISLTDELTGLYNRRGFFAIVEQQLKVIKRQKTRAFLLYADLDNFKPINDSFGHHEGDLTLIAAAGILRSTFRESDIIARFGGDEFVVFPIGDDEAYINLIVDRLQKNIDAYNQMEERGYKLSMSIGIAPYDPEYVHSIDMLIVEADKIMYTQKKLKH